MIEILEKITSGQPLSTVLFVILAIYITVKVIKDSYNWFQSFKSKIKGETKQELSNNTRLTNLETSMDRLIDRIDRLERKIDKCFGFYDNLDGE